MAFFIKRDDQINGPFTADQIKSGVASGKLKEKDLISNSKEGPWAPLATAVGKTAAQAEEKVAVPSIPPLSPPDEEVVELVGGTARVQNDPNRSVQLGKLAQAANPLRGAVKPGTEPGLESTNYFGPERGATANGVHAMIIEVDPDTLLVDIQRYVVVHDCGEVINPLILAGQIQGGVAQGIGNAFYEKLLYDQSGQLLNASFMDYLLPTALDVPRIRADHIITPSPLNPMGIKGAGESGAIPVGALFAQAIEDAIHDVAIEITEIPLSPGRLWEIVEAAR